MKIEGEEIGVMNAPPCNSSNAFQDNIDAGSYELSIFWGAKPHFKYLCFIFLRQGKTHSRQNSV